MVCLINSKMQQAPRNMTLRIYRWTLYYTCKALPVCVYRRPILRLCVKAGYLTRRLLENSSMLYQRKMVIVRKQSHFNTFIYFLNTAKYRIEPSKLALYSLIRHLCVMQYNFIKSCGRLSGLLRGS